MFYPLYYDVGSIKHGGVFFDPERMEFVEVIDADSAAGVDGTNWIEVGDAYIDEETIRGGLFALGRESEADRIVELSSQWKTATPFEDQPKAVRDAVLEAAEASHAYMGMDGGPRRTIVVVDLDNPHVEAVTAEEKREAKEEGTIYTKDPKGMIWKILKDLGVSRPR